MGFHRRLRSGIYCFGLTSLVAVASGAGSVPTAFASTLAPRGTLVIRVTGLPRGQRATSVLRGPDEFRDMVRLPTTIRNARAGVYSMQVRSVRISRAVRGIPVGSVALPVRAVVSARVDPRRRVTMTVHYGTIRSARAVSLDGPVVSVTGDAADPSAITVPLSALVAPRPGLIIVQPPTGALPSGLLDDVTAARRLRTGQWLLSLKPASLRQAYPSLDVSFDVPLGPDRSMDAPASPSARTAESNPAFDLGLSQELTDKLEAECHGSPSGWAVSMSGSLVPRLSGHIDYASWSDGAYGELNASINADAHLSITVPADAACATSLDLGKWEGWAGDFPVEGSVAVEVSISAKTPVKLTASTSIAAHGGVDLEGWSGIPQASVTRLHGNATLAGAAELSFGFEAQGGLGVDGIDGHVAVTPEVVEQPEHRRCTIAGEVEVAPGIDLLGVHMSHTLWKHDFGQLPCAKAGTAPIVGKGTGLGYRFAGEVDNVGYAVGLAVDPASDDIYVTDVSSPDVEKYSPSGVYLGSLTSGNGSDGMSGIAVDPETGDVYVADLPNDYIEHFSESGAYLGDFSLPDTGEDTDNMLSLAVDGTTGTVYVTSGSNVFRFDRSGDFLGEFGGYGEGPGQFGSAGAIAVDQSTNDVYVADLGRIERFDASGDYLSQFGSMGTRPGQFASAGLPIAVNSATHEIFVEDPDAYLIDVFSPSGQFQGSFNDSMTLSGNYPIAVDPTLADRVYLAQSDAGRILEFAR